MKNLLLKLIVLKIIHILILSQLVFAQNSFDKSFDEEQFRDEIRDDNGKFKSEFRDKGIIEFKEEFRDSGERYKFRERMEVRYDIGPSYEGYDKEMMLFGRLFHYIEGEMGPAEIKQYCSNLDEMAGIVISKVKSQIGEIPNMCNDLGEEESKCKERSAEHCSMMGQPDTSYAIDELHKLEILSSSCPVDSNAIKEACVLRMKQHNEDRMQYVEENCEYQWESYGKQNQENCERTETQMICDKSEYIENCLDRYGVKEDDFEKTCPDSSSIHKPFCENGYLKEMHSADGCLTGYECVPNQPQPKQCAIIEEEAQRLANECSSRKGTPERIYGGGCIREVKCNEFQCPHTEEQAKEKENACLASNGKPETIRDGTCVVEVKCHTDTAAGDSITGNAVGTSDYDYYKRQCYNEWQYQRQNCENVKNQCKGKDGFVNECIAREKGSVESNLANIKRQCEMDSRFQIKNMERQCAMMDAQRQRCLDESSKRCEKSQDLVEECGEKVTEENFRNFIIREAGKRCKFMPYMEKKDFSKYEKVEIVLAVLDTISEEEISKLSSIVENLNKKFELDGKIVFEGMISPNRFVDIKSLNFVVNAKLNAPESSDAAKARKAGILSGLNPEQVVEKLLELRETDISSEYKYLIEDKASDILEVSDDLDELAEKEEGKGIGYKIRLFLGFAKDIEEGEIQSLEMSKKRLETSIAALSRLADTVPDDIAKAILKAQVEDLERQKEDIDALIKQKEKKAKGLLRLFGLFG